MNSMQLKDKLKNISRKENVDFNTLLRNYMYERFIERLASSKYKNNFIIKGGYYLSVLFGIDTRFTMDIDMSLKNETLSLENISEIIKEVISLDINDGVVITFDEIGPIRDEDIYGGYRVKITVKLEQIRESFSIDIATGDPITPREIEFNYKTILDYKLLNLKSYNLETILAEKLETILSRKELSSRLKDYYDIYLIYKMYWKNINMDHYRKALENTFKKREYNGDIIETIKLIKESEILKTRWDAYSKKYKYARNINYSEIIECLDKVVEVLELTLNI